MTVCAKLLSLAVAALAAAGLAGCGSSGSSSSSAATASSSSAATSSAATSSAGSSGGGTSSAGSSGGTSSAATSSSAPAAAQIGFEGVPLEQGPALAPASTTGTGVVDRIHCSPGEQVAYHIHAHLAVFSDGRLYSLPGGIGIPGSVPANTSAGPVAAGGHCYYWLHTHTDDGVIHIESPTARVYTLGNFFDVWRQPLGRTRVATLRGKVTALVDGRLWRRSPRAIKLLPHEDIQLEIGEPTPPVMQINWAGTHL